MAAPRICTMPGCNKPFLAQGYCEAHYSRWRRHGDPVGGATGKGEPERHFRNVVMTHEGDDCLPWPYASAHGYPRLWRDGEMRVVTRLICEELEGPPPTEDHEAAHSCGHEWCCNKRHLRWATRLENEGDKLEHGTRVQGEKSHLAKLTESEVLQIRALQGTLSMAALGRRFNVTPSNIRAIHRRLSWAWLNSDGSGIAKRAAAKAARAGR